MSQSARLALGTLAFGRTWGLKYPRPVVLPSDAELDRLLGVAAELGVDLLDTAPAYGTAEQRLGQRLHHHRGAFRLATKAGEESTPDKGSHFDFRPEALRRSVERSLRRLRVDCLDIVFLHAGADDHEALEGVETLRRLQEEGALRQVGASTKSVDGGLAAVAVCDVVMLAYNPIDRSQEPVLDAAAARGVGVLVKKPLASGHWATKRSAAEALTFAARPPAVSHVVVGTTSAEHLRSNAAALEASAR
ncbi:MAG: aldo/keto reductase [Acidobacteriota bacterium]